MNFAITVSQPVSQSVSQLHTHTRTYTAAAAALYEKKWSVRKK